jgi:hypothetical protein
LGGGVHAPSTSDKPKHLIRIKELDASKNSSRIGGALIQSVVSEAERGHGEMDAGVLRH